MQSSDKDKRIEIASWAAIIIGLVIGILLRRVRWGMIIGIAIGILFVYLWSRKRRNKR